jgi:hypothetical protein
MHINGRDSAIAFGILYARLEDFVSKNSHRRNHAKRWVKSTKMELGSFAYCMIMLGLDETVGRKRFLSLSVRHVREQLEVFKEREYV